MKTSIAKKLFLAVSLLLIFVILTVILLNTTILELFYQRQKENSLREIYYLASNYFDSDINDIEQGLSLFPDEYSSGNSLFFEELSRFDSLKNIELIISDSGDNILLHTSSNFSKNRLFFKNDIFNNVPKSPDFQNEFQFGKINQYLSQNKDYVVGTFTDFKVHSDYMMLYGNINNNYKIFIRTPMELIRESVQISNTFLIIVGTICIFISSIVTYIIAQKFTKPIKDLNEIALNMSNLDFSKKYTGTSNDELDMLGKSINNLSNSLEKNIEELKNANMDLERDVEEKSKLNEMRNQFISDVSHELKTPIALIQGYAEGLIDGVASDEESQKYYINVILDEANKMSNLTADLLDLSKLEYDNSNNLIIQEFDITELINATLKKNQLLFNENNIKCSFENTNPIIVKADSSRIEQVLTNFISNAIKNIGGDKIIECKITDLDNNLIRVSVYNSGKHIDEQDLPRLWNRFYRVDSSRNRENGGSGIGLSLVKAIMIKHNNNYGVNNVDGGVEFYFELNKVV